MNIPVRQHENGSDIAIAVIQLGSFLFQKKVKTSYDTYNSVIKVEGLTEEEFKLLQQHLNAHKN